MIGWPVFIADTLLTAHFRDHRHMTTDSHESTFSPILKLDIIARKANLHNQQQISNETLIWFENMIWSILCNLPEFTTWSTFEHIQWYSVEIPYFSDFHCHWKGFWGFSTEFHLKFHSFQKTSQLKNISIGIPYDSYIGILRPFKTSNPVILKFLEKFRERFLHSVFSRFLTFSISINLSFYIRSVWYSI